MVRSFVIAALFFIYPTRCTSLAVLLAALVLGSTARGELQISATRVANGLSRPVFATAAPGDTDRLFIVEQHTGRIRILDLESGNLNNAPFLDLGGLATGNEQGLLGLAFDPDYATNGHFYVNLTVSGGTTHIRRYTVSANPDVANAGTQVRGHQR